MHFVTWDMIFDGYWIPVGEPAADAEAAVARAAELRSDPTARNVTTVFWPNITN